jgi:hypothetical protein
MMEDCMFTTMVSGLKHFQMKLDQQVLLVKLVQQDLQAQKVDQQDQLVLQVSKAQQAEIVAKQAKEANKAAKAARAAAVSVRSATPGVNTAPKAANRRALLEEAFSETESRL